MAETLLAHSAAQSSWLCLFFYFTRTPIASPPPLLLYLHRDPTGWKSESISDAFEVQDRWGALGTVKNESRLVIGEMFESSPL